MRTTDYTQLEQRVLDHIDARKYLPPQKPEVMRENFEKILAAAEEVLNLREYERNKHAATPQD